MNTKKCAFALEKIPRSGYNEKTLFWGGYDRIQVKNKLESASLSPLLC